MDQGDILKRLNILLEWSGALEEDRVFWRERFSRAPKEIQETLLEFFADFPEEVRRYTEFSRRKEAALAKSDQTAWKILVEEEVEYLELFDARQQG